MKFIYNWILNLCSVLFLVIIVATVAGVFFRYIVGTPLVWSDELARFSLVWMIFLGSAVVSFKESHLIVDFIYDYTSPLITKILKAVSILVVLVFLVILVISSFDLLRVSGFNSSPALDIPLSYWRASVVVGSILMIIAMIYNQFIRMKKWKEDK